MTFLPERVAKPPQVARARAGVVVVLASFSVLFGVTAALPLIVSHGRLASATFVTP